MKLLTVTHKNIRYEFRFLQLSKVIEISKGDQFSYLMKWDGHSFLCNCPSQRYRHYCWHDKMVKLLAMQPDEPYKPWHEWAEEAGRMSYGKERSIR